MFIYIKIWNYLSDFLVYTFFKNPVFIKLFYSFFGGDTTKWIKNRKSREAYIYKWEKVWSVN